MTNATGLVTGASGYIALHVVKELLNSGWTVHATVRYLQNERKLQPLKELDAKHPGRLKLFEADLLHPESFLPSMQNCSVVFHIASPFLVPEVVRDSTEQLMRPAFEGTRNILDCANRTTSVKRIVLTSSSTEPLSVEKMSVESNRFGDVAGAMYGDNIDVIHMENQTLHESYFNETSTMDHNPYQFSKLLAEKEAWRISRAQNRWDLVVICPGFVVGPTLSLASKSGSLFTMDQLLCGRMLVGVPDLAFALVDVRDVAAAHIRAAEVRSARGRYIVSRSEMTPFVEISKLLKLVHANPWSLPSWQIPNWILRLFGPLMGLSRCWIDANLGIRFLVDNTRSINELGIEYREVTQTLVDHYHSWAVDQGR
ncbi:hypothetical protein B0T10DRAFT_413967 [Thelonectria olida]|uniref:Thioester reductase (TE) domain-containing protein n=1 Tax=Thelonectria olida TaxID=1576542 RepID=A0A9P8VWV3_9HYPO|nr:hypothetical protein B0T10DRAFT_413967 [Thelonectria olida]